MSTLSWSVRIHWSAERRGRSPTTMTYYRDSSPTGIPLATDQYIPQSSAEHGNRSISDTRVANGSPSSDNNVMLRMCYSSGVCCNLPGDEYWWSQPYVYGWDHQCAPQIELKIELNLSPNWARKGSNRPQPYLVIHTYLQKYSISQAIQAYTIHVSQMCVHM